MLSIRFSSSSLGTNFSTPTESPIAVRPGSLCSISLTAIFIELLSRSWLVRLYRLTKKKMVATPITMKEKTLTKIMVVWIWERILSCRYSLSWVQCSLVWIRIDTSQNRATRKRKALNIQAKRVIPSIMELSFLAMTITLFPGIRCHNSSKEPFFLWTYSDLVTVVSFREVGKG